MIQKTRHIKVREIMQVTVYSVYPSQDVFDASVLMATHGVGSLPVVKEDGTLVGILTDRDIVVRCNAIGKDLYKTKVFECMTSNPIRTVPSSTLFDAMTLMAEYGVRRLPIIERDKLVGFISTSDIAYISNVCPNEAQPNESCILLNMAKELKKSSCFKKEVGVSQVI